MPDSSPHVDDATAPAPDDYATRFFRALRQVKLKRDWPWAVAGLFIGLALLALFIVAILA